MRNDNELISWLRLSRTTNIGSKTFFSLLKLHGSAAAALDAVPDMSIRGGRNKPIKLYSKNDALSEIERCENIGAKIIAGCSKEYPQLLSHISDPPPIITVLGDVDLLSENAVAIVGARNASSNGCRMAYKLSKDLKEYVVVSGLARGIDTASHKGALESGKTIAVVAGGIDHIYPKENTDLYKEISEKGAIIAECPIGTVPRAENFPRRNRIISGISLGAVIVEASTRSGSLITARMAMEQGREVMAVPGFPADPRAEGPNKLIKQGAALVENAADIIEAIQYSQQKTKDLFEEDQKDFAAMQQFPPNKNDLEKVREIITEKLGMTPVSVDDLIVESSSNVNTVLTILLELELAGNLERHSGNKVSLVMKM